MNARATRETFSYGADQASEEPTQDALAQIARAPDELTPNGFGAALWRAKGAIFAATLLGGAAALAYAEIAPPRFMAQSEVLVENQESFYTSAAPEGGRGEHAENFDAEAINSQIQLLTSRDLAKQAIERLDLAQNPEFNRENGALAALTRALRAFGLLAPEKISAQNLALTNFAERLTVMSPTKSRVLQIEFLSRDPELAAQVANLVAELYIDVKSQAKRDDASAAARGLAPLIAALEQSVAQADAKVEAFRAKTGLYESSENVTAPTLQYGEIAKKLAESRANQSAAAARADSLRQLLAENRLADASDIANNELVRQIAAQRVALRGKLAAQSKIYLPAHPAMRELQAQSDETDAQLRAALEQTARGLDNEAKTAATEVQNLQSLLDSQRDAVGAAAADAARLRELQRDAKVLRDQLTSLSAKYQAALARQGAEAAPADARIISRALAPSLPVFPKKLPLTLFGALAGLFFSGFWVAARALGGAPTPNNRRLQPKAQIDPEAPMEPEAAEILAAAPPQAEPTEADAPHNAPVAAPISAPISAPLATPESDEAADCAPIELPRLSPRQTAARDEIAAQFLRETERQNLTAPLFVHAPSAPAAFEPAPASSEPEVSQPKRVEPTQIQPQPIELNLFEPERAEPPSPEPAPKPADYGEPPETGAVSPTMVARIVAAGASGAPRHGAKILVASAPNSMAARASLTLARALARDGRAILVQLDANDAALSAALRPASRQAASPGLSQLLSGDASFGDIIHRDGASRLHVIRAGGQVAALAGDLDLVLDALRATYDYVILASGPSEEALRLAAEADLTLVFAEDDASRAELAEAFVAVPRLLRAGRDPLGDLIEAA